jgi:serine/threonine protein kinase
MDLQPGDVIGGDYQIEGVLARGGSSVIYVGIPLRGAGRVAIKQLRPAADPTERADDIRQFRREYDLLQSIRHPALPRAIALVEENDTWFLVEELVAGRTLRDTVEAEGRLEWRRALEIGLALLETLAWLHRHGVVYRDLQPANVLLSADGQVRLIDLGAARRWRPGAERDTVLLGTPGFAAPEQYGLAQTDGRADIFSIGALLHYMLTGLEPETQAWSFEAPHVLVPEVPEPLSRTVLEALALNPADRPQTAEAMTAMLSSGPVGAEARPPYLPGGPIRLRLEHREAFPYFLPRRGRPASAAVIGVIPSHMSWRRWRQTVAEIYDDGIRLFVLGEWWAARWEEVQSLRLTFARRGHRLVHAQFSSGLLGAEISGDWPGLERLVDEVLTRAGLVEDSGPEWRDSYVGTEVRIYRRPSKV